MSLKRNLERLLNITNRGTGRLPPAPDRAALPESRAKAYPSQHEATGAGIASPVTENKVSDGAGGYIASRTYVQETGVDKIFLLTSSDGLYTFEYKLLEQIDMTDANGEDVSFIYQEVDPDTGEPV
jgi:hypothetical protein